MQEQLLTIRQVEAILAERWPDDPPAHSTVKRWVAQGLFPGAFIHPLGNVWAIPRAALNDFQRPQLGRPPKKEGD